MDDFELAGPFGLSSEEKNDLEELIKASVGRKAGNSSSPSSLKEMQKKLDRLNEQIVNYARIMLLMDRRMNALYEIARLTHLKSELMSGRLEGVSISGNAGELRRLGL